MAENEGMEEKDLAQEKREEARKNFLEAVKDLKDGETKTSVEGLVVIKQKGQYIISMNGITFAIADEKGNFQYNKQLTELEEALNAEEKSLRDLNLPDLEEALDLEEQAKNQEQHENNERENNGAEEEQQEKGDEQPELEDSATEEIDKQTQEIAKQYNVNSSQVIHIAKHKKITDKNFGQIAKWAENYDDIFILPGEDEYSRKFIGVKNKEKEEIKGAQKQIGGKNPDILIKRIDGRQIEEIKPICMYEIDDKSAVAIVRDQYGRPEALYCRQEGGDKKTFWGTVIPEADGKNVMQQEPKNRDFMDYRNNSSNDLDDKAKALERQSDLEYRGLPSKEEGVQVEEIDGTPRQNREVNKEDIASYLMARDGIIDKLTVPPGYYENKADRILKMMEQNKDMNFEEAVDRADNDEKRKTGYEEQGEEDFLRGYRPN